MGGEETAFSTPLIRCEREGGPARIRMKDNQADSINALTEVKNVTEISGTALKNGDETHTIWDKATAYVQENNTYRQMDWNELNLKKYEIRAFYDAGDSQGGRIRIFIVTPR